MRRAEVFNNGILAGFLIEEDSNHYVFRYDDAYFADPDKQAISLTLLKSQQEYHSEFLFPLFSNMVAEGTNLAIQCRYLKIDERDILSLLGATAGNDTIGAVTIKLIEKK
ncbi:MAG: HipA N-terminal domain-containing protein [Bacteroidales bacterium]|nr:HipA N-terminal domain-containing protein [Bacteroidales bacterium]